MSTSGHKPLDTKFPTYFLCDDYNVTLGELLKRMTAINYYGFDSMCTCIARAISSRGVKTTLHASLADVVTMAFITRGLEYCRDGKKYRAMNCASWTGWRSGIENQVGCVHVLSHVLKFPREIVEVYFTTQCEYYQLQTPKLSEVLRAGNYSIVEIILTGLVLGIPCIFYGDNEDVVECTLSRYRECMFFEPTEEGEDGFKVGEIDDGSDSESKETNTEYLIRYMFDTFHYTLPDTKVSKDLDMVVSIDDEHLWKSFYDFSD